MKLTYRKDELQGWHIGDVISNGRSVFMIGFDHVDMMFRLISLYEGTIMTDKYKSIDELRKDNGDYNPVYHAEVIFSE